MNKIVGVIGATGYVGAELIKFLLKHPYVNLKYISSSSSNEPLSNLYPQFRGITNLKFVDRDVVLKNCDIIFTALPHGLTEEIAINIKSEQLLIDMGADFRLEENDYYKFYNNHFQIPKLHEKSIYSIPEISFKNKSNFFNIIANPGCYPTSIALGLAPVIQKDIVKENSIIIDAKSGITGAGKTCDKKTHFIESNENIRPYNIAGTHRHIPEIEMILNKISNKKYTVTFTPQLVPISRGMISVIYFDMLEEYTQEELIEIYKEFYIDKKFVIILENNEIAQIKNVVGSNYCHISIHKDERTNKIIIISVIDNMIKGAAGQAIQNMNIKLGLKEDEGIDYIPNIF
ncbi:MAG: N-acetyl-gamma-glutamyl-phosphate reductase [Sarcina sp.]